MKDLLRELKKRLTEEDFNRFNGRVTRVVGLTVESHGPDAFLGEMCKISCRTERTPWQRLLVSKKEMSF